jgi:hypothetical protein
VNDFSWGASAKLVTDAGVLGVVVVGMWLFYRLADKWAALFLAAQQGQATATAQQAAAMASLATTVEKGQSDQREILIAVRVLADRIDAQKGYLEEIEKQVKAGGKAA